MSLRTTEISFVLSLKKGYSKGDMIVFFKYLKKWHKVEGQELFYLGKNIK